MICSNLNEKIVVPEEGCTKFYKLYKEDLVLNQGVDITLADKFNLIKLIKGERVLLILEPIRIDAFWLRGISQDLLFKSQVKSTRNLKSCTPLPTGKSYELNCTLTSNTTGEITLMEQDEYPLIKTYEGVIGWTDFVQKQTTYQTVRIRMINLYKTPFTLGTTLWWLVFVYPLGLTLLVILVIGRKVKIDTKPLKKIVKIEKR